MTNEITFKLKAVAEDLDNTAANLWHVGGINMHARTCENVAESLRALIAKVESLAADAERYKWLRDIARYAEQSVIPIVVMMDEAGDLIPDDIDVHAIRDGKFLDAAIDAAMAKEKA